MCAPPKLTEKPLVSYCKSSKAGPSSCHDSDLVPEVDSSLLYSVLLQKSIQ